VLLDIDIRLRPDARSPAEARRGLDALRHSLDDHLVDDAMLLVSEIVSNSVRHAKLDPSDAIQVRIRGTSSMLHVAVVDPGRGFDPDALPSARRNGGWGLRLLDRLSSRWGVERNHVTRVWFELTSPVSTSTASGT
jgi:anti-sigma regulatory factor (Ser/Thr protein kinase)